MFRLVKILNGRANVGEPVRLPSTPSTTYAFGEALALASGKLIKCDSKVVPTHICGEDYVAPASDNKDIVVTPVSADMIFEVPFSAVPSAVYDGDKVTIGADGLTVTATKENGVATIFEKAGASATGDKCLVQFK
jgi:hypothetical protein